MATVTHRYDHPSYTTIHTVNKSVAPTAAGNQAALTFSTAVKSVVTRISAILRGSLTPTTTLILTILFNNSVAAILTVTKTVNETMATATLTSNRTLAAVTDYFMISTNAAVTADCIVDVIYEYKIAPAASWTTFGAIG